MYTNTSVYFCKYILIITGRDSNSKKYASCQIHCCTTCNNFGSVLSKQIIQSFIYLKIMLLVKLVESSVGDVAAEVMFQKPYTLVLLFLHL